MNFTTIYHTHLDKFEFSFLTKNLTLVNTSIFKLEYTTNKDYLFSYKVYYHTHLLGRFHISNRLNPDYSYFTFENYILYTSDFQNVILDLINTYDLKNLKIKKMEISIDTNQPLILRFMKKYYDDMITFNKNYDYFYFGAGKNRKKHGLKKAMKYETVYIKSEADKPKTSRNRIMRIENKTNEINDISNKNYIINYLNNKGLDTNKDIYRMELILTNDNTLKNRKTNQTTIIDFSRLTDSDYLTSIFNFYSVFDHSQIIDTRTSISIFKPEYADSITVKRGKRSNEIEIINNELNFNHIKVNIDKITDIKTLQILSNEIAANIASLNNCNSNDISHLDDLFKVKRLGN